jgi:hypothetical protein
MPVFEGRRRTVDDNVDNLLLDFKDLPALVHSYPSNTKQNSFILLHYFQDGNLTCSWNWNRPSKVANLFVLESIFELTQKFDYIDFV